MAKRIKRPPVKPEKRQEWLRRYELDESPPKIAKADGYDVRTVRKQIRLAQEEREGKEARIAVLREAVERHHRMLCDFAEKLDAEVQGEAPIAKTLQDDRMWKALKQHMPRSSLWYYLDRWDSLQQQLAELKHRVKKRLERGVDADPSLKALQVLPHRSVFDGLVEVLGFQMEQWCRGRKSLTLQGYFRTKDEGNGLIAIEYGAFNMGTGSVGDSNIVRKVTTSWESKVKSWKEYKELCSLWQKLENIRDKLREELAVIILRGVVRGHCIYCPM